eukprot:m.263717 g.263717  ORF g.263717 m.263717 type:complete len:734 (-) comp27179_c0_seq1:84-2285(-)
MQPAPSRGHALLVLLALALNLLLHVRPALRTAPVSASLLTQPEPPPLDPAAALARVHTLQGRLLIRKKILSEKHGLPEIPFSPKPCPARPAVLESNTLHVLPILLFIVGVEGAGHHALETVWQALSREYDVVLINYDARLHGIRGAPRVSRGYHHATASFTNYTEVLRSFAQLPRVHGKQLIIDARNSYPAGFGVGSLAHPDVIHAAALDGKLVHFRALFLTRDPTACAISAVNRFFGPNHGCEYKNYQYQARMSAAALALINNNMAMLPCDSYIHLRYEALGNSSVIAARIAALIGVDAGDIDSSRILPRHQIRSRKVGGLEIATAAAFFARQRPLWPLLAHARSRHVPRNNAMLVRRPRPHAPGPKPERFLVVDGQLHLGFNNVLFVLQIALHMARLLGRRLAFPEHIHMRVCADAIACAATPCRRVREFYECPLRLFLDAKVLEGAGVTLIGESELLAQHPAHHDMTAFDDLYNPSVLWLDEHPRNESGALSPNFRYYEPSFSCEFINSHYFKYDYPGRGPGIVKGFVDRYRAINTTVLYLHGDPHRPSLPPYRSSTVEGLARMLDLWAALKHAIHPDIIARARHLDQVVRDRAKADAVMCVHLRRGDFSDLGWNRRSFDLEHVMANIQAHRRPGDGLYIATDESDLAVLEPLRRLKAIFWDDVATEVTGSDTGASMLAFADYVGQIEQRMCAEARTFVGSHCSSFSGNIVSVRRIDRGDGVLDVAAAET